MAVLISGLGGLPAASLAAATPAAPAQPAPKVAAAAVAPAGAPAAKASPTPPPVAPPIVDLAAAQASLGQLQSQILSTTNDARLAALGQQATALEAQLDPVVAVDDRQIADLNRQLKKLEPPRHRKASPAELKQTAVLLSQRAVFAGQLAQVQPVLSTAAADFSLTAERRREGFSARVLERSPSPLTPGFWATLGGAADDDVTRVQLLVGRSLAFAARAPAPKAVVGLGVGLFLALILAWPVRVWLDRLGRRKDSARAQSGGARHTLGAVWTAMVDVGAPTLAAWTVHAGIQWGDLVSPSADAIAASIVSAVAWASAILALGRVMATDREADRRLMKLSDEDATRIRLSLWPVAVVSGAGIVIRQINYTIGASVAATIAANCVLSLAYAAAAALILLSVGARLNKADENADEKARELARSPVWTLISLALALAIGVTVTAVLSGYTTLAALVSGQMFWLSLIAGVTYLLLRLVDDVFTALLRENGAAVHAMTAIFGLRRSTTIQAGLLISAALQVVILIAAVTLALTPYGQSGELLLSHIQQLGGAVHIGQATISPNAIISGLAAFGVGIVIANAVRGWVTHRYLPATDWDSGLRNSVSTGVGYLGVGIALVTAFAVMGLGFQQIALIASALSVGIGFGLQQIVQNFVAGVILLIERPVKVGDWVNVGGVEGDVRRIRVRATEIQAFDRSIVIVPNSNLITMNVQNKTLRDVRGRIQLQLTVAKVADARKAAGLVLDAAKAKPEILQDPPPAAYADALAAGGGVTLNCYFYVESPRDVYRLRSELLFLIIDGLQREGVALL